MDLVSKIYDLRQNFMIIGLTGRTGSGCTTVAELLKNNFAELFPPVPTIKHEGVSNEDRKYRIEYTFLKHMWEKKPIEFKVVRASDIIFYYALKDGWNDFLKSFDTSRKSGHGVDADSFSQNMNEVKEVYEKDYQENFTKLERYLREKKYESIRKNSITVPKEADEDSFEIAKNLIDFIENGLPQCRKLIIDEVVKILGNEATKYFQDWGSNIRKYGSACTKEEEANDPSKLAETINYIIKMIRAVNKKLGKATFVIIDSLRNPYEVHYFRERYSAFYLMSINVDNEKRIQNLQRANYRKSEIDELDKVEYPSKRKKISESYYTQDVEKCVELSDIHIAHSNEPVERNSELKRQLIHFIALILHPGLVQPTPEERLMQVANTAKLNSGCISRQVGAVVTDANFSVKSIGWNTVAQGQTPCSLRTLVDLYERNDLTAFSCYEKENQEFTREVKVYYDKYLKADFVERLNGVPLVYCFKDFYTVLKKGEKNQVHTRSLHAEENAFLQLAKYGSEGIKGGYLFTTASPCELCAKKAYQLGIEKVYYIDIYPGISNSHIFQGGNREVELIQFSGAIGRAYEALYNPFFALKDEIEYMTGVKVEYECDPGEQKTQENKNVNLESK